MQQVVSGINNFSELLNKLSTKKFLLVCGSSFYYSGFQEDINSANVPYIVFSEFTPNPLRKDALKGIEVFNRENCDLIVAIGGGSAIDVAKCIKLDGNLNAPIIAIPTTAGTGSESTRHIVVYENEKKLSISDEKVIPEYVILDAKALKTLPDYQKKCALLDALCQSIESRWSKSATADSIFLAEQAIKMIMANKEAYINDGNEIACKNMLLASNFAGQAINVTATTAAHAMSYKISSIFKIPHGYAVAVSLPFIWEEMLKESSSELKERFVAIAIALGGATIEEGIEIFKNILKDFCMNKLPETTEKVDVSELVDSVNPERLKNNPVKFTKEQIEKIYKKVLGWDC